MKLSLLAKTESVGSQSNVPVPMDIHPLIYEIRGQQVILDRDLSMLYGVPTKALNQAVKRNAERFPDRFMFRLSESEMDELVTNCDRFGRMKHSSAAMCAFTEQGIAMLSSVLRSAIAVRVSIRIMDAFVAMRKALASMVPMQSRLEAIAKQCGNFTKTICGICHDRFIIADQKEIYWSGASLKDAGRLTFARPCGLPSKARRFFGGYSAKLGAEMIPGMLASIRNATSAANSYKKGGAK